MLALIVFYNYYKNPYETIIAQLNDYLQKDKRNDCTSISVDEYYIGEDKVYLALIESGYMWDVYALRLEIEDGKLLDVSTTSIEGNKYLFDLYTKEISQGNFLVVYLATHMGSGTIKLYTLDDLDIPKYEFTSFVLDIDGYDMYFPLIDNNYELSISTAIKYSFTDTYEDEGKVAVSSVYEGGKLTAYFEDINNDGHTDIIFKGIQELYLRTDESDIDILKKEFYCKFVALYDSELEGFVYSKEYTQYIELDK